MFLVGGDAVGVDPVLFLPLTVLDGTLSGDRLSLDDGGQKMRSFQTIGDDIPVPGSSAFQMTFLPGAHSVGT